MPIRLLRAKNLTPQSLSCATILLLTTALVQATGLAEVSSVMGSGGGVASSRSYSISDTMGQPVVDTANSKNNTIASGFWNAVTPSPRIFSVTTVADSGPGSLRQAILDANASNEEFVRLEFSSNLGAFVLSSALPTVTRSMTIATATGNQVEQGLSVSGSATVNITGSSGSFGAQSVVDHGSIQIDGNPLSSSLLTLTNGGQLTGTGAVGGLIIADGGIVAPGGAVGSLNSSNIVWAGGGTYDWQINDAAGIAGTTWDFLSSELLRITSTSANPFRIKISSLNGASSGEMTHFVNTQPYAWTLATATNAIIGFAPENFTFDTNFLVNSLAGGKLAISVFGNDLKLTFSPGSNHLPVASPHSAITWENHAIQIPTTQLLTLATDGDGDPLTLTGVSATGLSGGTVRLVSDQVTYTPPKGFKGSDHFTYCLTDNKGGVASAIVLVTVASDNSQAQNIVCSTNGARVQFQGIPGLRYTMQRASTLEGPWIDLCATNAPAGGVFIFSDPAPPVPTGFYRLIRLD